jgi:hypothetical protein
VARKTTLVSDVLDNSHAAERLAADAELARLRSELASSRGRYKAALAQIEAERARADAIAGIKGVGTEKLSAGTKRMKRHDATVIVLLSDWHVEERVDPATVNGLNDFSLAVAERRIAELAERFAVLLEHERRLVRVDRVVIWLGGDFMSGAIHDDTAELAQLPPLEAIRWAGRRIRGFIDLVADMAREVVVVTNSGNHGRTTDKLRIGTEMDHSFEQHFYIVAAESERRKNVRWQVGTGYLNMLDLDGFVVRFHHGHAVRYSGAGVGGITIPVNKAIASWDKIQRADLTCMGHYHQFQWLRAGRYVANGSLIGHSAYATTVVKGAYEPPSQSFIVVDHGRKEVTKAMPIFCDRDLQKKDATNARRSRGQPGNPRGNRRAAQAGKPAV